MQLSDWEVLEGLRGVLALHVLLQHAKATPEWFTASVSQFPSTTFFIVLSGFSFAMVTSVDGCFVVCASVG